MRGWLVGSILGTVLVLPHGASAYEQREGTFSIGIQGQLHGLLGASGDEYELFVLGKGDGLEAAKAGIAVRLRFAIDRKQAFGFGFQAIGYDRAVGEDELADFEVTSRDTARSMHISAVSAEYVRYFNRKAKDTPYATVGLGWFRPEIRFQGIATRFPGSGAIVSTGVGLEHFFAPSVSLDVSARANGLFADGGHGLGGELALGLRFYHLGPRRR